MEEGAGGGWIVLDEVCGPKTWWKSGLRGGQVGWGIFKNVCVASRTYLIFFFVFEMGES